MQLGWAAADGDIKLPQFVLWWTANLPRVYSCLPPTHSSNQPITSAPLFFFFFLSQRSDTEPHLVFGCVWSSPVREAPPSLPQVQRKKQSDLRSGPRLHLKPTFCVALVSRSLFEAAASLSRPLWPAFIHEAELDTSSHIVVLNDITRRAGGYNLFMSSMVNPAGRDVPGNIIDLDLRFFHYLQSRKLASLMSVPEQQRLPTVSCRCKWSAINQNSSETNYHSFNEGIPQLENKSLWPRTSCWMSGCLGPGLCGIQFQFTGLAWNIHQAGGTAESRLDPTARDRTVQESYPIM